MTFDGVVYRVTLPYACFGVITEVGYVGATAEISWYLFRRILGRIAHD